MAVLTSVIHARPALKSAKETAFAPKILSLPLPAFVKLAQRANIRSLGLAVRHARELAQNVAMPQPVVLVVMALISFQPTAYVNLPITKTMMEFAHPANLSLIHI